MTVPPAPRLRFRLLGPVSATLTEEPVALGPPQQRCVLAALLLEPGRTVPADRLMDVLWARRPSTAKKALQVYVSNLRRLLAAEPAVRLVTDGPGYRLDVSAETVDLHRFRCLVGQAEQNTGERSRLLLHQAQRLWAGTPLTGIGNSPVVERIRADLAREGLTAVDMRIRADISHGHLTGLVPELNDLLTQHPLDERLYESLMRTLWADDRVNEALAVFRDARRLLTAELGVQPGPALTGLHQRLLGIGTAQARSRPAGSVVAALPMDLPDFCGRHEEIDTLRRELRRCDGVRAVMVVAGPGGIGKTSLAVHVARTMRADFPDGILFADLAGTRQSPAGLAVVLAGLLRDLGVTRRDIPESIVDRSAMFRSVLADRKVLVVLDDVLDAAQVGPLLPGGNGCAVLVTSRNSLADLDGARVLELGVLSSLDAIQLFRNVVGEERTDADAVEAIIVACGHFPLAVRLAGARLAAHQDWILSDFVHRLHPASVLDELAVADVAVRNSFALSYDGLDAETARAFRLLALPEVADFSAAAAAALLDRPVGDTERLLDRLTDSCLLQSPGFQRYRYHDLLRLFGRTMAQRHDSEALHRTALLRFAGYQMTTALNAVSWLGLLRPAPDLKFPPGGELAPSFGGLSSALRWLAVEHVSMRGLMAQTVDLPDFDLGSFAFLACNMSTYAEYVATWQDWSEIGGRALAHARRTGLDDIAARIQLALGKMALQRNDIVAARELIEPMMDFFRRRGLIDEQAHALMVLGTCGTFEGRFEGQEACLREVARLHRQAGNVRGEAASHINLASLRNSMGDHEAARDHLAAAAATGYPLHDQNALSMYYYSNLGGAARGLGDHKSAARYYERTLSLGRQHGNKDLEAITLLGLTIVHVRCDRPQRALSCFREALELQRGKPGGNVFRHLLRGAVGDLLRFGDVPRSELRRLVDAASAAWWTAYLAEL